MLDGSFAHFELVVSNNGDPEDTRRLASTIHDPRIRWVEQDQQTELFEHLRAALRLAHGEYVAVLHDDDWWSPEFLETLVPALERHPEAVLAFSDHYIVNQFGEVKESESDVNTERWGRANLREGLHQPFFGVVAHQSVAITGCVFRRGAFPLDALTPDFQSCEDVWMIYLMASGGGAAYFSSQRLMYYRAHEASYSSAGHLSTYLSAIRYRRTLLADARMGAYKSLIIQRLARDHLSAGAVLLRRGKRGEARSQLADALRLRPSLKALGGWTASWVAPSYLLNRL